MRSSPSKSAKTYAELNTMAAEEAELGKKEGRYFEEMASRYSWAVLRLKDALVLSQFGSKNLSQVANDVEASEENYSVVVNAVYQLQDFARQIAYERRVRAALDVQRYFRGHRVRRPSLLAARSRMCRQAEAEVAKARRVLAARARWRLWLGLMGLLVAISALVVIMALRQRSEMASAVDAGARALSKLRKEYDDQTVSFEVRLAAASERTADAEDDVLKLQAELNRTQLDFQILLRNVVRVERAWPFFSLIAGLDAERLLVLQQECNNHQDRDHCINQKLIDEDLIKRRMRPRQIVQQHRRIDISGTSSSTLSNGLSQRPAHTTK